MDPSLVLFDADGRELDRDRDTNRRDPMIDFTAPADGTYYVELHDFLYVGSGEYYYRLSIDSRPHLDLLSRRRACRARQASSPSTAATCRAERPRSCTAPMASRWSRWWCDIALPGDRRRREVGICLARRAR